MKRPVEREVQNALADALDVIEDYQNSTNPGAMEEIWELVGRAFDISKGY